MSENRFEVITNVPDELGIRENRTGDVIVLKHRDLNSEQFVGQLCMFLNDQNDMIIKLVEDARQWEETALTRIKELEKENETLKVCLAQANSTDNIKGDA